ncbi:MAG: glycogen synthase GlgA [Deltaproteobacteria bacterium]|nr:glycogen synthase GlgA [Deltaproteobacteria bacterium]MBW2532154.1 glycogen synthase GlgA [Deltaproteobacteria bacterium]
MNVLFVVSECAPVVKVGGLGDVAGALPAALRRRGHDVRVVMPRYRAAKRLPAERLDDPLGVPTGAGTLWSAVWQAQLAGGVPLYLIEHDALFDRDGIYGNGRGEYGDNLLRFAMLSRAAIELCPIVDFGPDLFHVHDWQSALVPFMLRTLDPSGVGRAATVLTVHNQGYQGLFPLDQYPLLGFGPEHLRPATIEHFGALNLLKAGLVSATRLTAVSARYAAEIQTPLGGAGLDGVMRARAADLTGILNGIDDVTWNPATDPLLPANYDVDDLSGKAVCKEALQRELGLPLRADVPLVGLVSRFAEQKGIDVFADALGYLLDEDLQFAVLGSGEPWAEAHFGRLSHLTQRFRARIGYDEGLAHRIEAGADLFVMPSRYEPCGLNQMYSQRYGTMPIVRAVGGLKDTVEHELTGFTFAELSGKALAETIALAAETYREGPEQFRAMQRLSMRKNMGWDRSASQYDALYRLAIAQHSGRL